MHECPHCKHISISSLQKLCSVAFMPATCPDCSRYSYLQLTYALKAFIAWVILTWVFIGLALYQRMTIYLIGTIPAMLYAVDRYMLHAPMRAIIVRR
jgi:hypothetical protein